MQMTQRRALVVAFLMLVPACWAAAQDAGGVFDFLGPDTSCFLSLTMYNPDNPANPFPVPGAYTYIYQLLCLLDDNFIDTLTLPIGGPPIDVFVIERGELPVLEISVEAKKITFTFPTFTGELTNPMVVITPLRPGLAQGVLTGVFEAVTANILAPVGYAFNGFLAPVDNPPTVNSVQAGSGVPVTFSLGGDLGQDIFARGFPTSQQIACDGGAPSDEIETVSAGGSGLTYDPASDTYTYVWKTSKGWAGTCRQLILRLNDGSEYSALFRFR